MEEKGQAFLQRRYVKCDDVETCPEGSVNNAERKLHGESEVHKDDKRQVVYGLEDVPPWYATILFGFQQFLASFGGIVSVSIIVGIKMCMSYDTVLMGRLMCSGFMVCGIGTLLQSTFGCRLAIIQGQGAFFVAVFAILDLKGPCPAVVRGNSTNEEMDIADNEWRSRVLELSGAILVASTVQIIIGATGCIGLLLRFVGPLTITPAVTLLGLAIVPLGVDLSGGHWGIAGMTAALVILFSQYLAPFDIPIPAYNSSKRFYIGKAPIFKLFPIVIAILTTWIFSAILTAANVFPDDPSEPGYSARTDINVDALHSTPWLLFPYPGQWGTPTVSAGAVFGIIAGVLCSILESVGDYYACARISSAPKPPHHAINRGILMEGIACICAGAWGTGIGVTSYSECVGNIGLTRVGSRIIAQVAAVVMLFFAVFAKVGALFATMPHPIIGGSLLVGASMVLAIGLSNLQFVNLNSTRNLLVAGFSLSCGFGIPLWLRGHPEAIQTSSANVDSIMTILLTTDVFVGALVGFILDNTIPGTMEERGMLKWLSAPDEDDPILSSIKGYDLPFGMDYIRRSKLWSYLPISPTFQGFPWDKRSGFLPRGETTQKFLDDMKPDELHDSNDFESDYSGRCDGTRIDDESNM
ncbi:solute carrier family 23 member 1-like [Amphiura filiformis]|uniref:solute carrier family 23 member 1-like n=1 Tax=Amphiura filiformis TaxID=82378 RepID=UPI003B210DEB